MVAEISLLHWCFLGELWIVSHGGSWASEDGRRVAESGGMRSGMLWLRGFLFWIFWSSVLDWVRVFEWFYCFDLLGFCWCLEDSSVVCVLMALVQIGMRYFLRQVERLVGDMEGGCLIFVQDLKARWTLDFSVYMLDFEFLGFGQWMHVLLERSLSLRFGLLFLYFLNFEFLGWLLMLERLFLWWLFFNGVADKEAVHHHEAEGEVDGGGA